MSCKMQIAFFLIIRNFETLENANAKEYNVRVMPLAYYIRQGRNILYHPRCDPCYPKLVQT